MNSESLYDYAKRTARFGAESPMQEQSADFAAGVKFFNDAYAKSGGDLKNLVNEASIAIATVQAGEGISVGAGILEVVEATAEGNAIGTSIGSAIPVFGSAAGAVIGTVVGFIVGICNDIFAGDAPNPQNEFRSHAERMTMPALPLTVTPGISESQAAQVNTCLFPSMLPTFLLHSVGFKTVNVDPDVGDPAPNEVQPYETAFGVGWISPPKSTALTTNQAYMLVQAWKGQNSISKSRTGVNSEQTQFTSQITSKVMTSLGGPTYYNEAIRLLNSFFGNNFSTNLDSTIFQDLSGGGNISLARVDDFNISSALDFTYYIGDYLVIYDKSSVPTNYMQPIHAGKIAWSGGGDPFFSPMPNTIIFGIAELIVLGVTGVIPKERLVHAVLHYVMSINWLWLRGGMEDNTSKHAVRPNRNFLRLIGRLSRLAHADAIQLRNELFQAQLKKAKLAGKLTNGPTGHIVVPDVNNGRAQQLTNPQSSGNIRGSNWWKVGLGTIFLAGIAVLSRKKPDDH